MNQTKRFILKIAGGVFFAVVLIIFGLWLIGKNAENKITPTQTATSTQMGEQATSTASKIYSIRDLDLVTSNRKVLITYGSDLVHSLQPLSLPRPNELQLIVAANPNDPTSLAGITKSKTIFQTTIANLLAQTVPSSAAKKHLELVNSLELVMEDLTTMEKVLDQPLLAMETAKNYPGHLSAVYQAINSLNKLFISEKIPFDSKTKLKIYVNL